MITAWGDLAVCDAHVHFFSDNFLKLTAAQKPELHADELPGLLGWEAPATDAAAFAARWVAELDRHGVSKAAIIASVPGDEGSVASAVHAFPDRFYGYWMCNPLAPEALTRVEAALDEGLRGICFFPAMQRYSMHDDRVLAILQAVSKRPRTVAFVHCGVLSVGIRRKLGLPSPFDLRYSNPIDLHAVALQFAGLPFVIPHFGAGYFREVLMVADLCPNVYLDTSSSNSWVKYQPETTTLVDVLRRALAVVGPGRLLFGTDSSFFPRGWHAAVFHDQVRALDELKISAEHAARILGGNLQCLFE
jgi:predicted TIM-barrel fold metal-dependent hydrolase